MFKFLKHYIWKYPSFRAKRRPGIQEIVKALWIALKLHFVPGFRQNDRKKLEHRVINTEKTEILKYFTERGFRPLTLLASDDDKLRKFSEMKDALASGGYSQISLDF